MIKLIPILVLTACGVIAATTNNLGLIVQIDDAGNTLPTNSIATPAQVGSATAAAATTLDAATATYDAATNAQAIAQAATDRVVLYSTNYVVTSTVYVQSIGGIPYDPSNQTINVTSIAVPSNIVIVATLKQIPLIPPVLDWRIALDTGAWSNITATATQIDIPEGITNAATAYQFELPKPAGADASSFFRVVDNSTGASGSGLYWLVYGGIYVDGRRGYTGAITNIVGSVTNTWQVRGGIVVDPDPL